MEKVSVSVKKPVVIAEVKVPKVIAASLQKGRDGVSITKAEINSDGELVITFSDESTQTVGVVVGKKGEAFTYDDFTEEQLEALKGEKGDAFTYDDFTEEQLEALKGEKGDAFTFDDFTPEQLEALKGEKGESGGTFYPIVSSEGVLSWTNDKGLLNPTAVNIKGAKGNKGDAFTYDDFTEEQLEALKGKKGEAFTYDDFTEEQLEALKGEKGDAFTYEDFTEEQLEALKGEKGNAFTYDDFTEEQLEALKGKEGESGGTFYPIVSSEGVLSWTNDKGLLNPTAVNIKGPKGNKGDAFTYDDFTEEQLNSLKNDIAADVLDSLPVWTGGSY